MKNTIICLLALLVFQPVKQTQAYPKLTDESAILAIIGEAESEIYLGKLAVAEVIRRRGSLKGIYGVNSPRVKNRKYSQETYLEARSAWFESLKTNVSLGAQGWGNKADLIQFRKSKWFQTCEIVTQIGNHYFWKEK